MNALIPLLILAICAVGSRLSAGDLVLADGGESAYRIVLADNASPSTRHGAEELQMFLERITGAKLPIVSDRQPMAPKEIILGDNAHLRELGIAVDLTLLGREGYVIRTVGERLVIAGGRLRGNMYGVYGFLEDHLGCRWFAPGVSRIPKSTRLRVGPIEDRRIPVLEYREPYVHECLDGDWCARNRMNSSNARIEEKHGGKLSFADGFFCHTFAGLVPPEKYFDEHPEYFSMVDGRRRRKDSQLCCTHPDVIRICTDAIVQAMCDQPRATVFSVSQNDRDHHCECSTCQNLAKQEDSQMAPVLYLVNRVAKAVEEDFPDRVIETLAYQWSRRPPKHMRPRPNVVIRLCSIECCFSHPLAACDDPRTAAFRDDLKAWAKISPRLWVWNYGTNFHYFLLPFPNHRVRGPNVRFFVANNVKGIFEQDNGGSPHGELSALGGYVTAKLMWNPDYDGKRATDEFLQGYYGKAAGPIRSYVDLLSKGVDRDNVHVGIYCTCNHPHLTHDLLLEADGLWQRAEKLVAAQPEVLRRVKLSRMSVDFALLEKARLQMQGYYTGMTPPPNGLFMPTAIARLQPFFETLQGSDLTHFREAARIDKAAYRRELAKDLGVNGPR